jgi:p-cumate 2,3-dioxygenase alpha subunit
MTISQIASFGIVLEEEISPLPCFGQGHLKPVFPVRKGRDSAGIDPRQRKMRPFTGPDGRLAFAVDYLVLPIYIFPKITLKGGDMTSTISFVPNQVRAKIEDLVVEDKLRGEFKVNRRALVDETILELERRLIFDHCWLYLGHVSEVSMPGSFISRSAGGRRLIFNRDRNGKLHAFHNTCSHRGAMVCREPSGRGQVFHCAYHGWAYNDCGVLINVPGPEAMAPALMQDGSLNLKEVPKLEEFCGFVFVCFDPEASTLEEYLGGSREILELVAQQSGEGMEIIQGGQQYCINGNWKLLAENSIDAYHAATTHITYMEYLGARDAMPAKPKVRTSTGRIRNLGNGHAMMESPPGSPSIPWGRPYARWVPGWGEEAKKEIDGIMRELVDRLGEERARLVGLGDRNCLIFPNLVINDIMAITIRTFFPVRADYMEVSAWALAPKGESPSSRERRLRNFVEFLGPAGLATPDDVEMLELCQKGYANTSLEWNDLSRGMLSDPPAMDDEEQLRVYWRRWREIMSRHDTAEVR